MSGRRLHRYYAAVCFGGALALGLLFWVADSALNYYFFHENLRTLLLQSPESLWDSAFTTMTLDDLLDRVAFLVCSLLAGAVAYFYLAHQARSARVVAESEARYRSLVHDMQDCLVRTDREGYVTMANSATARVLGLDSAQDLMGRRFTDFYADPGERMELLAEAEAAGPLHHLETELRRTDGSSVWTLGSLDLYREEGEVQGLQRVFQDISERKQAERELVRAKEAAEAATRSKSEFLANMSHEIRTPLNGIMGMLQMLLQEPLEEQQRTFAEHALHSGTRLNQLLADILDLSRVEAGRLTLKDEPFVLADAMQAVTQLFAPAARSAGLEFSSRLDPALPATLCGDTLRLQQVLSNLVGNAIKFTPEGSVTLRAERAEADGPDRCRVRFSVADTGVGIAEEYLEEMFTAFSQEERNYTRSFQGAGLGLSITKRLVELMGGSLEVESEPGTGSTFRCTLDFGEGGACPAPGPEPLAAMPGARILVAEDDEVSGLTAVKMLEHLGHEPALATDGRQALRLLSEQEFDLVLMDVQMPVMNGVEATRAIREGQAGERARHLPVLALTAYAMKGDEERMLEAGMDAHLTKPLQLPDLADALARHLGS